MHTIQVAIDTVNEREVDSQNINIMFTLVSITSEKILNYFKTKRSLFVKELKYHINI